MNLLPSLHASQHSVPRLIKMMRVLSIGVASILTACNTKTLHEPSRVFASTLSRNTPPLSPNPGEALANLSTSLGHILENNPKFDSLEAIERYIAHKLEKEGITGVTGVRVGMVKSEPTPRSLKTPQKWNCFVATITQEGQDLPITLDIGTSNEASAWKLREAMTKNLEGEISSLCSKIFHANKDKLNGDQMTKLLDTELKNIIPLFLKYSYQYYGLIFINHKNGEFTIVVSFHDLDGVEHELEIRTKIDESPKKDDEETESPKNGGGEKGKVAIV